MNKKYLFDLHVVSNESINGHYNLLKLTSDTEVLPVMSPGQFVEMRIEDSPNTLLRRPISIHYVDRVRNEIWLLILPIGHGTRRMARYRKGDIVNVMLPLGHGFTIPSHEDVNAENLLLVGGGVGSAPMLYLGKILRNAGFSPLFLIGARSANGIVQQVDYAKYGDVYISTEDGSVGERGFVTDHTIWKAQSFGYIYACGPKPMMIAVAKRARQLGTYCEVSLENKMGCGIGACLCCIEDTIDAGHVCVCTEGPVFNIDRLKWLI